ncbi:hypothetical protein DIPPA_04331 [Diplonema papillatum]|nr:hypothetical protein DIPPA_04331 [Diplonema papillatum]
MGSSIELPGELHVLFSSDAAAVWKLPLPNKLPTLSFLGPCPLPRGLCSKDGVGASSADTSEASGLGMWLKNESG